MTQGEAEALALYCADVGQSLTDEQREFACNFTEPLLSISNPGTGKTFSIIAGLVMAQTYHRIPGAQINAMSYTRVATTELQNRYTRVCERCRIRPTVQFNTFHSLTNAIVHEVYPNMRVVSNVSYDEAVGLMSDYLVDAGFNPRDDMHTKNVVLAIDKLNASMIFDAENVQKQSCYKDLDIPDINIFQKVRRRSFLKGLNMHEIVQGDIPLYALYCLSLHPELCQKYKNKFKIMVVDEFQDFTPLYLRILSMISTTLVAIGDLKQQIYGFNGSSMRIMDEYRTMYPGAKEVSLTKSFRCKDEIAEYATSIYKPNDESVVPFTGVGSGGKIKYCTYKDMQLSEIVAEIKSEQDKARLLGDTYKPKESMFLFRNNISAAPIAEELYKQGVLFQLHKFTKVMDMPIFRELCWLADIASEPDNMDYLHRVTWIFPEFKGQQANKCPLLMAIRRTATDILTVPYDFQSDTSREIISRLAIARERILTKKSASEVFNALWPIYEKYIIKFKWYTLPREKDYYISMVSYIVTSKTYPQMVAEEWDKDQKIKDALNARLGVKCYTIHSAKGLEADDVWILDAEDAIFPSEKSMERLMRDKDCKYEAALNLRNERNLLYVAATRAKTNLILVYRDKLTELVCSPMCNKYSKLDEEYRRYNNVFDEYGAYKRLLNIREVQQPVSVIDDLSGISVDDL